jgi:hypothetical protein
MTRTLPLPPPWRKGRRCQNRGTGTSDSIGFWTTGAYSYDGSGNVWKTGNSIGKYSDRRKRLPPI